MNIELSHAAASLLAQPAIDPAHYERNFDDLSPPTHFNVVLSMSDPLNDLLPIVLPQHFNIVPSGSWFGPQLMDIQLARPTHFNIMPDDDPDATTTPAPETTTTSTPIPGPTEEPGWTPYYQ